MIAPVLVSLNFELPFFLETDESKDGLGGVLAQVSSLAEQVIVYLSRATSKNEKIWDPRELEALAVVWACEELRPYLIGKPFTLITDHANLKWIMHTKHTKGKLAKWAVKRSEYDFDIIRKPGRAMTNVDALSCLFPKSNQNQPDKAVKNGIHLLLVDYAFPTRSEIAFSSEK